MMRAMVLLAVLSGTAVQGAEPSPFETEAAPLPQTEIDKLVFGELRQLGIPPANVCSDSVFLRRVYLDVIGTLPTADEVKAFLEDQSPRKRAALIDRLLERPEFADYWAMKWSDLLRVKGVVPINLWPDAAQAYHRWIRTCIKENVPYDRFARELLTASGSNVRVPQANFYRAVSSKDPASIAGAVALTFLGERAERWPKERLAGMAALFSQVGYKPTSEWKEEIVFWDFNKADAPTSAIFPDGTRVDLPADKDPRIIFADWLITPKNPWFTRNIANRVWSWLLGRGIIHEADDVRPDNPPSNPELLAFLEKEFITARYDMKYLYRLILNSRTYQLSSVAKSDRPEAKANFASYRVRRMEAEVLMDALNQLSVTMEKYSSGVTEPNTFIPETQRAIELADGTLTSPFLTLFGRPMRATGMESERNNLPTPAQELYLLNSNQIRAKMERIRTVHVPPRAKAEEVATSLYLAILSRYPTEEESKTVAAYLNPASTAADAPGAEKDKAPPPKAPPGKAPAQKPPDRLLDLVWALVNSEEFLYRH
jgi:hypothetical protein